MVKIYSVPAKNIIKEAGRIYNIQPDTSLNFLDGKMLQLYLSQHVWVWESGFFNKSNRITIKKRGLHHQVLFTFTLHT